MIDKSELLGKMRSGRNCSQCVFSAFADRLDYSEEELERIAAVFGGGMGRGDTCGAVTGGLMALGCAYGDDKELVHEKAAQFQREFSARFGSLICRELLGYDFSTPGEREKAVESGVMSERCPNYVCGAAEMIDQLLDS